MSIENYLERLTRLANEADAIEQGSAVLKEAMALAPESLAAALQTYLKSPEGASFRPRFIPSLIGKAPEEALEMLQRELCVLDLMPMLRLRFWSAFEDVGEQEFGGVDRGCALLAQAMEKFSLEENDAVLELLSMTSSREEIADYLRRHIVPHVGGSERMEAKEAFDEQGMPWDDVSGTAFGEEEVPASRIAARVSLAHGQPIADRVQDYLLEHSEDRNGMRVLLAAELGEDASEEFLAHLADRASRWDPLASHHISSTFERLDSSEKAKLREAFHSLTPAELAAQYGTLQYRSPDELREAIRYQLMRRPRR